LLAFNELTVSALLWSAGTETLGVALLSLEDPGRGSEAAAVAVAASVLVCLLMLAMQMLARRLPENALPWQALGGRCGPGAARGQGVKSPGFDRNVTPRHGF
jgi:iron(III) transport system permease protein